MSIGGKLFLAVVFLVFQAAATINHLGAIPIALAVAGFVGFLFSAIIDIFRKITPHLKSKTKAIAKSSKASVSGITQSKEKRIINIEDSFYKIAGNEILKNEQDEGLWFKSLAIAEGDKTKQEAIYIRLRAQRLHETHSLDNQVAKRTRTERQHPSFKLTPEDKAGLTIRGNDPTEETVKQEIQVGSIHTELWERAKREVNTSDSTAITNR